MIIIWIAPINMNITYNYFIFQDVYKVQYAMLLYATKN